MLNFIHLFLDPLHFSDKLIRSTGPSFPNRKLCQSLQQVCGLALSNTTDLEQSALMHQSNCMKGAQFLLQSPRNQHQIEGMIAWGWAPLLLPSLQFQQCDSKPIPQFSSILKIRACFGPCTFSMLSPTTQRLQSHKVEP